MDEDRAAPRRHGRSRFAGRVSRASEGWRQPNTRKAMRVSRSQASGLAPRRPWSGPRLMGATPETHRQTTEWTIAITTAPATASRRVAPMPASQEHENSNKVKACSSRPVPNAIASGEYHIGPAQAFCQDCARRLVMP
jgi:hypothetical protein